MWVYIFAKTFFIQFEIWCYLKLPQTRSQKFGLNSLIFRGSLEFFALDFEMCKFNSNFKTPYKTLGWQNLQLLYLQLEIYI